MKLVAQTSRRPGCSRNAGMILSSSLVTPCSGDGGSPERWEAISSTSSMNTTACSSSAISRNVSRSAPASPLGIGGQPGREDLHERPLQPGRDRLRKGRLTGAGRAEEHDGARRHHAVFVGEVGLGEGQDQAALQQFLLVAHAGHVFPQVTGQDPAAQQAKGLEFLALDRNFPLEVAQVLLEDEAAAQERLHPGFGFRHQRGELVQPVRGHPVFDGGEQRGADPAAAVFRQRGEEDDPALVVRGASDGGTHHRLALHRDDGVVLFAGGQHLGERVDRLDVRWPSGIPRDAGSRPDRPNGNP